MEFDFKKLLEFNNPYWKENSLKFNEIFFIVKNNKFNYSQIISNPKRKYLKDWIEYIFLKFLIKSNNKNKDYSLNQKIFMIINGMIEFPKCKICGKILDDPSYFIKLTKGFKETCNEICKFKLSKIKFKNTCIKTYGYQHPLLSDIGKKHYKKIMIDRYGVENSFQLEKSKITSKKTKLLRYGNQNYLNINKIKKTRYEKNNGQYESQKSKEKRKLTFIKHYGTNNNMKSDIGKKEFYISIERKYGVKYISQSRYWHDKVKQINQKKYHTDWGFSTEEIKQKSIQTCLKKYGVKCPMQCKEIQKKAKRKYTFNGQKFDSMDEISFVLFLNDNFIKHEFQPNKYFEYFFNNSKYLYFPDFYLTDFNLFVEIKGAQFFKNGKMIDPYKGKNDDKYEAKHQCMISNNVLIIRTDSLCMKIIKKRYPNYMIKKFKNK